MAEDEDEEARKKRAEELRRAIEDASERPPASPREFTDRRAREEAAKDREEEE